MLSPPLVYFDWNATAPLTEEVIAFLHTLEADSFLGNGSSVHRPGQKQRARLEQVRAWLKQDLQADELVWTSSATEAHNLLFSGFETSSAQADRSQRVHRVPGARRVYGPRLFSFTMLSPRSCDSGSYFGPSPVCSPGMFSRYVFPTPSSCPDGRRERRHAKRSLSR